MILSKFSIKKLPVGPARGQYGKYLDRKFCYFILLLIVYKTFLFEILNSKWLLIRPYGDFVLSYNQPPL